MPDLAPTRALLMGRARSPLAALSLLAGALLTAGAAELHVAPTGDDAAPGTAASPLRSISAASRRLRPGDRCLIRGGVYRETVRAASGVTGAPVVYQAYPGETVTITGCELVLGWQRHAGPIHVAAWTGTLGAGDQLFIAGQPACRARWPNHPGGSPFAQPLATAGTGSGTTTIRDPALPRVDLTGALVWILAGCRWEAWTTTVTASAPGALTFPDRTYAALACRPGASYVLSGSLALLDAPGEWFAADGRLYAWVPGDGDPAGVGVEAKVRPWGFDLAGAHDVQLSGLSFVACSLRTDGRTADLDLDHLTLRHIAHWEGDPNRPPAGQKVGLNLAGRRITLRNSTVMGAAGSLIGLEGAEHQVRNCLVAEAGYAGTNAECLGIFGEGQVVTHCTIRDSGRSVVGFGGRASLLDACDVSGAGLLTWDVGLLTTGAIDGGGSEIRGNRFHGNRSEGLARGIFLSTGSGNFLIRDNVVWDCWEGGFHAEPPTEYVQLLHNTFWSTPGGPDAGGVDISSFTYVDDQVGMVALNNIFTDDLRTFGHDLQAVGNLLPGTDPGLLAPAQGDFRLRPDSLARGAGWIIPGSGATARPDAGAAPAAAVRAGHDFSQPITAADPLPAFSPNPFANRVVNGGFEFGLAPWRPTGMAATVQLQGIGSADPTLNTDGPVHGNRSALRLRGDRCGVVQEITGLEPGATYILTGWFRLAGGETRAVLRVTGGVQPVAVDVAGPGQHPGQWLRRSLVFTAGPADHPVSIALEKESPAAAGDVLIDDVGVVRSLDHAPLLTTARIDCTRNLGSGLNQVEYFGHWRRNDSWTAEDRAVIRFTGRQAVLYAQLRADGGIMAIAIDQGPETLVNTYYPQLPHHATVQPTAPLFRSPLLAPGPHELRIWVTGRRQPAASGAAIRLVTVAVLAPAGE